MQSTGEDGESHPAVRSDAQRHCAWHRVASRGQEKEALSFLQRRHGIWCREPGVLAPQSRSYKAVSLKVCVCVCVCIPYEFRRHKLFAVFLG